MFGLYLLRRKFIVFWTAGRSEVIAAHRVLVPRTRTVATMDGVLWNHTDQHLLPAADSEVVQIVVGHRIRSAAERSPTTGTVIPFDLGTKPGRRTDRVEEVTAVHRRPHLRDGPLARRGSRIVTGANSCDVSRGTAVGLIGADHSKASHGNAPEVGGPQIAIRSTFFTLRRRKSRSPQQEFDAGKTSPTWRACGRRTGRRLRPLSCVLCASRLFGGRGSRWSGPVQRSGADYFAKRRMLKRPMGTPGTRRQSTGSCGEMVVEVPPRTSGDACHASDEVSA